MDKETKRCYKYLDLSYDATIEEVRHRQKLLIKVFRARAISKGRSAEIEVQKIRDKGNHIVAYIQQHGVGKASTIPHFVTDGNSMFIIVGGLITSILAFLIVLGVFFN